MSGVLVWFYLYMGLATLVVVLTLILTRLINLRFALRRTCVLLELTPPAITLKSPLATVKFFGGVQALMRESWFRTCLGFRSSVSFEIVSTRQTGIRYLVRLPAEIVDTFKKQLAAYIPAIKFKQVNDYLPELNLQKSVGLNSYRQAGHFAYPLASFDSLDLHDPISYIAASMTNLKPAELVAYQLILTNRLPRAYSRVKRQIDLGQLPKLKRRTVVGSSLVVMALAFKVIKLLVGLVASVLNLRSHQTFTRQRQLNLAVIRPVEAKLAQLQFNISLRTMAVSNEVSRVNEYLNSLDSALKIYSRPGYQALVRRRSWLFKYAFFSFAQRLPSSAWSACWLSLSEVAALYHFPYGEAGAVDNLLKSYSRTLAAPVSLKGNGRLDVVLGVNFHHGSSTAIGLTLAERQRHVFIIGGTGSGKTTMLLYSIIQDIKSGKGVAVVDPHGDLAEAILKQMPKKRIDDVVYFNPDDLAYPVGINLLELKADLSGDELIREKDLVTEATVSVLRKIFSDDGSGGLRVEYFLRNCIQTALTLEHPTLFTIFSLLNDPNFRRKAVKTLEDKALVNFWRNELGRAGEFQKVKIAAGITSKVGRFLFSASAKRVLEQERSTIDFTDIMDSSKILICNLSKGLVGEDTSTLFGTTILAKLQIAALRRARQVVGQRRAFYLYVDEFQNFATVSFTEMLSEARKYQLFLTMAEQSTAQQQYQRLVEVILANVGTVVCFRTGSSIDAYMLAPLFKPFINELELANLPAYNFYMRMAAVKVSEPVSGQTLLLNSPGDEVVVANIIKSSRRRNAIKYKGPKVEVESESQADRALNLAASPGSSNN